MWCRICNKCFEHRGTDASSESDVCSKCIETKIEHKIKIGLDSIIYRIYRSIKTK